MPDEYDLAEIRLPRQVALENLLALVGLHEQFELLLHYLYAALAARRLAVLEGEVNAHVHRHREVPRLRQLINKIAEAKVVTVLGGAVYGV